MIRNSLRGIVPTAHLVLFVLVAVASPALAQHSSTNYRIEENFIGPGGIEDADSSNYNLRGSLGDTGNGLSNSPNYRAVAGYTTTGEEIIEFMVNTSDVDLGVLSTSSTRTGTGTFSIRQYNGSGYVVQIYGNPPTQGSEQLDGLASPTASTTGTEQYGINLVDNATPNVGANPAQIPDSSFSFGAAATGYGTADSFKYVSGDTIAQTTRDSGQTNYTISIIANMSTLTPGGVYTTDHKLVVVPTY